MQHVAPFAGEAADGARAGDEEEEATGDFMIVEDSSESDDEEDSMEVCKTNTEDSYCGSAYVSKVESRLVPCHKLILPDIIMQDLNVTASELESSLLEAVEMAEAGLEGQEPDLVANKDQVVPNSYDGETMTELPDEKKMNGSSDNGGMYIIYTHYSCC